MNRLTKSLRHRFFRRNQAGQTIILMALGMVVLLAFVGLVTDVSLLFVRFSQLRRAVDSASIAAAGQVRENRDYADIALSARQFIRLHGLDPDRVLVQTCVTNPGDPELCVTPPRKLIRVIAQVDVPTTFLRLLGWGTVTLEASATSETAVLDVALVLDTSESMSRSTTQAQYTAIGLPPSGTPSIRADCAQDRRWQHGACCNDPGNGQVDLEGNITGVTDNQPQVPPDYSDLVCQPFKQVRDAARAFVQRLDFTRGDRVVFVTFDLNGVAIVPEVGGVTYPPLITDEAIAIDTLNRKIGVHVNDNFLWTDCVTFHDETIMWRSYEWAAPCNDTNMGGGILTANDTLTNPLYVRRTAVWVMIVLSDGAANVTPRAVRNGTEVSDGEYGYHGFCPWYTFCWPPSAGNPYPTEGDLAPECTETDTGWDYPWCSDADPFTRHFCMTSEGRVDLAAPNCDVTYYDAADFAMDMADFAGLVEVMPGVPGNFMAMYSIGFGTPTDPISQLGEEILRYVADAGDNGLIDSDWWQDCRDNHHCADHPQPDPAFFGPPDPCDNETTPDLFDRKPYKADCGQYWYADNMADLDRVFAEIASRLFTRLAR